MRFDERFLDEIKSRLRLSDAREKPHGLLKVTANTGFGSAWLAPRLAEFRELYPDIELVVILTDDELDLSMRESMGRGGSKTARVAIGRLGDGRCRCVA